MTATDPIMRSAVIAAANAISEPSLRRTLHRTSLDLPDDLTFDEWRAFGVHILSAGESLMWWIGDWLNHGERLYGDTYTQAAEWTRLDYSTLAHAKSVAKAIAPCRRRQNLSWSHHVEVAPLDADTQERVLADAERDGLTVRGVRDVVRSLRAATPASVIARSEDIDVALVSHSLTVTVAASHHERIAELLARIAAGVQSQLRDYGIDGEVKMA